MNTYVERELTKDEILEIEEQFDDAVVARSELYGITRLRAAEELTSKLSHGRGVHDR